MIRDELLNDIAKGIWHIEENAATAMFPLVYDIIMGEGKPEDIDWSEARARNRPEIYTLSSSTQKEPKNVGVAYLRGTVTKYDQFSGARGTKSLVQDIKEFDNDPEIAGTVLVIDSPGGSAGAHRLLENVITQTQKPVVAFVDGMAASAAYGIAASTEHIVVSDASDLLGSIGTMMSFWDFSNYYAARGIERKAIYARVSPQKNHDHRAYQEGDLNPMKDELDEVAKSFIQNIKSYRGDKISSEYERDVFEGKHYMGNSAIKAGLADSMGTFEDAVNKIFEIKNEAKMQSKKYNAIERFFGMSNSEQEEKLEKVNEAIEAKEAAEAKVKELEQQLASLQAEKDTMEKEVGELQATNNQLTDKVSELETKLDKTAENNGTQVIPGSDAGDSASNANKPWNNTPWMKEAVERHKKLKVLNKINE